MNVEEEFQALFAQVQQGNKAAEDEMIMKLAPFAKPMVRKFLRSTEGQYFSHLQDDLIARAQADLVRAVKRLLKKNPDGHQVRRYLALAMKQGIRTEARESGVIRISDRSYRRRQKAHKVAQSAGSLPEQDTVVLPTAVSLEDVIDEPTYAGLEDLQDTWSLLEACCESPTQIDILHDMASGDTQDISGQKHDVSQQRIQQIITGVRDRVNEKLEEMDGTLPVVL